MPISTTYFREEDRLAQLIASQKARFADPQMVASVQAVDAEWRQVEFKVNQARKESNAVDKSFGVAMKAKKDAEKKSDADALKQAEATIAELTTQKTAVKASIEQLEVKLKELAATRDNLIRRIGNIVHESVPISNNEDDNVVVKTFGDATKRTKYHHHELLHMIDGYSAERGTKIAGSRGYFLKGVGVALNQALIQYGLNFLRKRKYIALQPPFFMKKNIMAETAQLEEFDEALYHVTGSGEEKDFYLIATSEQPISAYHRDETLTPPADQPIRYAGISTCFRKEAGSYGRDAWGIFRIHQFEKVEQFCITNPEKSWEMHEEMMKACEEFYQSLGLSYRIVNIVSGALNNAAAKKYDLEAWFPTMGVFRELVSASNCTDYQSRAMNTKFGQKKSTDTETPFVHMLNATLCATERTICCLLENYQTEKGVAVPEVLRPFMEMDFMPFVNEPPKATETANKLRGDGSASSSSATAASALPASVQQMQLDDAAK